MELVISILLLVGLAIAFFGLASYDPVGAAVATANLQGAAGTGPEMVGWASLAFKIAAGFIGSAVFAAAVAFILRAIPNRGKWTPGPNANWKVTKPQATVDPMQAMMMILMSRMLGGSSGQPQLEAPPDELQSSTPESIVKDWWQT